MRVAEQWSVDLTREPQVAALGDALRVEESQGRLGVSVGKGTDWVQLVNQRLAPVCIWFCCVFVAEVEEGLEQLGGSRPGLLSGGPQRFLLWTPPPDSPEG